MCVCVCVCDVTVVSSGYGGAELFKLSVVSVYRFLKCVMSSVFVMHLCFSSGDYINITDL